MTDLLSLAAQATWCAYEQVLEAECVLTKTDVKALAAALRAAADTLLNYKYWHDGFWDKEPAKFYRKKLLTIADELEGNNG
jgi:hypothetical protein